MNTCPAILNRKEGFEVQSFINEIGRARFGSEAGFSVLQKLERMIREYVPLGLKKPEAGAEVDDRKLCVDRLRVGVAFPREFLSFCKNPV